MILEQLLLFWGLSYGMAPGIGPHSTKSISSNFVEFLPANFVRFDRIASYPVPNGCPNECPLGVLPAR